MKVRVHWGAGCPAPLLPSFPPFHLLPSPGTHPTRTPFLPTLTHPGSCTHHLQPRLLPGCLPLSPSEELRYFNYGNVFLPRWNLPAYAHVLFVGAKTAFCSSAYQYDGRVFELDVRPECQDPALHYAELSSARHAFS